MVWMVDNLIRVMRPPGDNALPALDYVVANTYTLPRHHIGEHTDSSPLWGGSGDTVIASVTMDFPGIFLIYPGKGGPEWAGAQLMEHMYAKNKFTNRNDQMKARTTRLVHVVYCEPNSMVVMGGHFQNEMAHATLPHDVIMGAPDHTGGLWGMAAQGHGFKEAVDKYRDYCARHLVTATAGFPSRTVLTFRGVQFHSNDKCPMYAADTTPLPRPLPAKLPPSSASAPWNQPCGPVPPPTSGSGASALPPPASTSASSSTDANPTTAFIAGLVLRITDLETENTGLKQSLSEAERKRGETRTALADLQVQQVAETQITKFTIEFATEATATLRNASEIVDARGAGGPPSLDPANVLLDLRRLIEQLRNWTVATGDEGENGEQDSAYRWKVGFVNQLMAARSSLALVQRAMKYDVGLRGRYSEMVVRNADQACSGSAFF